MVLTDSRWRGSYNAAVSDGGRARSPAHHPQAVPVAPIIAPRKAREAGERAARLDGRAVPQFSSQSGSRQPSCRRFLSSSMRSWGGSQTAERVEMTGVKIQVMGGAPYQ